MKNALLVFLIYLLLPLSCFSPRSTVKPGVVNLSNMYNPVNTKFHPAYTVYHNSPGASVLLIKIFPVELLYAGGIEPNKLLGQVRISWVLTDIDNPAEAVVADSGKVTYTFEREDADKRFVSQVNIQAREGKKYQLMILAKDLVRNDENLHYLYVDKSTTLSAQNYMLLGPDGRDPFFQPYVIGGNNFSIDTRQAVDSLFVFYYGGEIPLPRPAFSQSREIEFLARPDSLWKLPYGRGMQYQLNYPGVYMFRKDTAHTEGLTVFNFGENYPKVQTVEQMIEPLAYLSTSPEYEALKKSTNRKLAVDNFWIEKAGNIEKARELIRVYYNRVYFANYYFTTFKPGWKTDRGMIFIIFGPPQSVKVTPDQERWMYYKNNYTTSVTFVFNHLPFPFALNNYVLQRSDSYDTYWRQAVDTWRSGKIYLIE